jgi:putative ABC transport system permease protein
MELSGLFKFGASFAADGTLIMSDLNFLRLFPHRKAGEVSAGLITLKTGIDPQKMVVLLKASLPMMLKSLPRRIY